MLLTRNLNEHRIASIAVAPDARVWRMVEIELAQPLFIPTWRGIQRSRTVLRRALLSEWEDVQALLDAMGEDALCHLQCLYPPKIGVNGPWSLFTIKKAWRAVGEETGAPMVIFEDEEGKRYRDFVFSDEPLAVKEQVWPPVDRAP
jgi:hypothetical protein